MKKKIFYGLILIVLILLIISGGIIINLIKDFGIENLGKSISALYQCKIQGNDYTEIMENTFLVNNEEVAKQITYKNEKETVKDNELSAAIFKIYKNHSLYSIVKFEKSV